MWKKCKILIPIIFLLIGYSQCSYGDEDIHVIEIRCDNESYFIEPAQLNILSEKIKSIIQQHPNKEVTVYVGGDLVCPTNNDLTMIVKAMDECQQLQWTFRVVCQKKTGKQYEGDWFDKRGIVVRKMKESKNKKFNIEVDYKGYFLHWNALLMYINEDGDTYKNLPYTIVFSSFEKIKESIQIIQIFEYIKNHPIRIVIDIPDSDHLNKDKEVYIFDNPGKLSRAYLDGKLKEILEKWRTPSEKNKTVLKPVEFLEQKTENSSCSQQLLTSTTTSVASSSVIMSNSAFASVPASSSGSASATASGSSSATDTTGTQQAQEESEQSEPKISSAPGSKNNDQDYFSNDPSGRLATTDQNTNERGDIEIDSLKTSKSFAKVFEGRRRIIVVGIDKSGGDISYNPGADLEADLLKETLAKLGETPMMPEGVEKDPVSIEALIQNRTELFSNPTSSLDGINFIPNRGIEA